MMPASRPNPDLLLQKIFEDNKRKTRGHFRLFFGMSAGVGKTYAMLRAAQELKKDGVDVQVGIVETHGRQDTALMLEGLPIIPRKKIEYKGTVLDEMDLDEILRQKPKVVLVDELAHSNVPGSRYDKRYQDVQEILESGIDVYATLNVQHLESRADIIELITATPVRETIPDSILDWVDQIELIDLTPEALIERLKEGKVYPGRKIDQALSYFFQEKHLGVLREIVLRVTADKVDRDTREIHIRQNVSKTESRKERILVAISHSPHSDRLVRMARRLVEDLEVDWIAVHVDTGVVLDTQQNNQLIKNLELARNLGAETITLHGTDFVKTITDYASEHQVLQILIGRPEKKNFWHLKSNNIVGRLIEANPQSDVIVLQKQLTLDKKEIKKSSDSKRKLTWQQWSVYPAVLLLTTSLSYLVLPLIGYRAVGFLFLLAVVILSLFSPFLIVVASSFLAAALWNFFFIPPFGTLTIHQPEDIMMCLAFFIISSVTGYLTAEIKKNQEVLRAREHTTRALYDLLKSMTLVKGQKSIVKLAISKIESLYSASCCILIGGHARELSHQPEFGDLALSENDRAVAVWSFDHGKMAGWSTETLPSSQVLCLTLKSGENKFGVLIFKPKEDRKLNPEQQSLLISITNQISVALAKERYEEETKEATLLKESEKLHQTLLNCISHELRTPLTAILGAATAMQSKSQLSLAQTSLLTDEIINSSERLGRIFENLFDMSRLESGRVRLNREWFDLAELLRFTLERQKRLLTSHKVNTTLPENACYFQGDFELLEHAVGNLILNAVKYSPPGSEINLSLEKINTLFVLSLSDQGPGIPEAQITQVFDKFYRVPGSPSGGLGLGLSIAKNLIELHCGTIRAENRPQGGIKFMIELPSQEPPAELKEGLQ